MLMDKEIKMTIANLLEYLYQQLLQRLDNQSDENAKALNDLRATLIELSDAAEHHQDWFVYEFLDDMLYLLRETSMGSRAKGESVLPALADRVKALRGEATYNCIWEPVRALADEERGYIRLILERTENMAGGGTQWDIPALHLPQHLRRMGSRFMIRTGKVEYRDQGTIKEIRRVSEKIEIKEREP
jgi:hypothetical protein